MSEVELIRRIYEQAASQGPQAVDGLIDPDIEWDTSAAPTGVKGRGQEVALGDIASMLEAWEEYEVQVERLVPAGEAVVPIVRNRGRGRAGGVPIEATRAHLWRVRDGRAVAMRLYFDPREALGAAGIEPGS